MGPLQSLSKEAWAMGVLRHFLRRMAMIVKWIIDGIVVLNAGGDGDGDDGFGENAMEI